MFDRLFKKIDLASPDLQRAATQLVTPTTDFDYERREFGRQVMLGRDLASALQRSTDFSTKMLEEEGTLRIRAVPGKTLERLKDLAEVDCKGTNFCLFNISHHGGSQDTSPAYYLYLAEKKLGGSTPVIEQALSIIAASQNRRSPQDG